MLLLRLAILVCLVVSAPPIAVAGPGKKPDPAAAERRAGLAAFDVGDYAGAVAAFERAYRLDPDPRLLYNLGLAYRKKHELSGDRSDLVRARDAFVHFLALARSDDPRFKADRAWLAKVQVLAARYRDELEAELEAGERPAVTPVEQPRLVTSAPPPARRYRNASLALLVGGAAAGIAAGVTGALAWRDASRAEELADEGDHAGANQRAERADRLALTSDLLLSAAVVSAGVGAFLWWRGRPARVSAGVAGDTVGLALEVGF